MQAHLETAKAGMENQAFYLMARMHVIFRRESNRITDIEYMRISPDYCRHILDLAAQSAIADLREIGAKLEDLYFGPQGLFARFPAKFPPPREKTDPATKPVLSGVPTSIPVAQLSAAPIDNSAAEVAYVGRLR
jgi:hypothetical protein